MDKKWRKVALLAMSVFMASAVVGGLAGCGKGDNSDSTIPDANLKKGTYRTYTPVMPSNWNELTYEDNNDTQILQ